MQLVGEIYAYYPGVYLKVQLGTSVDQVEHAPVLFRPFSKLDFQIYAEYKKSTYPPERTSCFGLPLLAWLHFVQVGHWCIRHRHLQRATTASILFANGIIISTLQGASFRDDEGQFPEMMKRAIFRDDEENNDQSEG